MTRTPTWKVEHRADDDFEVLNPGNRRKRNCTSLDDAVKYLRRQMQSGERAVLVDNIGREEVLIKTLP